MTTEEARSYLQSQGFFVGNLWTIHDVRDKFDVTEEEAQTILKRALICEAVVEDIQFAIKVFAEDLIEKKC